MNTLRAVLPWTIVTATLGGVIWFLLARDAAAGRWLLAAFLIGHGAVHLLFAAPGDSDEWPFDMGQSWLVSGGMDRGAVQATGWVLITVAVIGFAVSALSTVGLAVPASWWQTTTIASSIASAGALVVFFSPQLVLGLGIDLVLALLAGLGSWLP